MAIIPLTSSSDRSRSKTEQLHHFFAKSTG